MKRLLVPAVLILFVLALSGVSIVRGADDFCTQEYDPVCSTDGYTYSNACQAEQAGATVDYRGECREGIGDDDDDDDIGVPDNPDAGCFIATAAFGTPLADEVNTLREFRDEYLLATESGKEIVSFYYEHSPSIAEYIEQHDVAKHFVRETLGYVVLATEMLPGIGED